MSETIKSKIKRDLRQIEKFGIKTNESEHLFSTSEFLRDEKTGKITHCFYFFFCEPYDDKVQKPYISFSVIEYIEDGYDKLEFYVKYECGEIQGAIENALKRIENCPDAKAKVFLQECKKIICVK